MATPKTELAPATGTVFIIQQPRPKDDGWSPDFSSAIQYGKLEFIFGVGDRAYADPREAKRKAAAKLANFNPAKDYLLWANFGDPATAWIVIMILVAKGYLRLCFLYWSRGRSATGMNNELGFYFPVELDVTQLPHG